MGEEILSVWTILQYEKLRILYFSTSIVNVARYGRMGLV